MNSVDDNAPFGRDLGPMITDAYAPVAAESVFDNMPVIGEIPADLNGVYLRNGPNQRFTPNGRYHWFDGDAMLHGAHFDRGRVTYRNRWIESAGFVANDQAGRELYQGVIETHKDRTDKPMRDTPNTDVIGHAGTAVTSWYLCGTPYRVDPITLQTLGPADYARASHGAFSSHPKVDERTGEMMFFDYWNEAPYMSYGVVDKNGALAHQVPIPLPGPRLPHDLAITANYSILHDLPLFYDMDALAAGRHKIAFYPDMPARFGVIPRYGLPNEIRWFEASPCFVYHVVNAYEDGDEIVMIACRYMPPKDTSGRIDAQRMAKMIALLHMDARLWRWRFNLKTGMTTEAPIDAELNLEFPTVNNGFMGQPSQYAYLALQTLEQPQFLGLAKVNTGSGVRQLWRGAPTDYFSEAPFAPADHATSEDHGYLLSFVWRAAEQRTELQIFDARELARGPVTRIHVPARVPAGFHATWMRPGHIASYAAR